MTSLRRRFTVVGLLGWAWLLVACGPSQTEHACPSRFSADAARQDRIVQSLQKAEEGARALKEWGKPIPMCFGPVSPSVVTERGTLLLDASQDDTRAAARVAHLLLHLTSGMTALVQGKGDCDARVEQALAAEARALGLELRLLQELRAPPPPGGPWEVESVYWAAPPEGREAALLGYFKAHPDGAKGVDALAAGYAKRCAAGPDAGQ